MYCATSESADLRLSVADILSSMANGVPDAPATTTVSENEGMSRRFAPVYTRVAARPRPSILLSPSATALGLVGPAARRRDLFVTCACRNACAVSRTP